MSLEALRRVTSKISEPRVRLAGKWHKPTPKEFYTQLPRYEQISINTPDYKNAIIFDVDDPDQYAPPEIAPYCSTFNRENGKHHALFLLDKPIHTKSRQQREWYREKIGSVLQKIYFIAGADPRYRNATTKNPFNQTLFDVREDRHILKSVFDLISLYNADLTEIGAIEHAISSENRYISPKYRYIVSQLIEHSHLNAGLIFSDRSQFERSLHLKATQLCEDARTISRGEAERIAHDVFLKSAQWADTIRKRQQHRVSKRWGDRTDRNREKIVKAFHELKARGIKPTYQAIADKVGLSVDTIKRRGGYAEVIQALKKGDYPEG
jgi:hypothetical protein